MIVTDLCGAGRNRGPALNLAFGNNARQQRGNRRTFESGRQPEHDHGDKDSRHGDPAAVGAKGQISRGDRFSELGQRDHPAAIVAVRDVAGDEHHQRGGNELHQPDHAELEGGAGQLIDLPAHGNGGDLRGKARATARTEIEQERSVGEQHDARDRSADLAPSL